MRAFVSIGFPAVINRQLEDLTRQLKAQSTRGSFTLPGNFHVTLAFLGEVSFSQVGLVQDALRQVKQEAFSLTFSEIGHWSRPDGGLYWLGVSKNPALSQLQKEVAAALGERGFVLEKRAFQPHLTLGRRVRLAEGAPCWDGVYQRLQQAVVPIEKVSLMESTRITGKLCYVEKYHVDLEKV